MPSVSNVKIITSGATYSVTSDDTHLIIRKSPPGPITVELPATPEAGRCISVKDGLGDSAINPVTISSETNLIDSANTYVLKTAYGTAGVIWDGSRWDTIATAFPSTSPAPTPTPTPPIPTPTSTKRDAAMQPFSSTSCWNIGIGSGALWLPNNDQATIRLQSLGNAASTINGRGNGYYQPHYIGISTDPLVTVYSTDKTDFPCNPFKVHLPIGSLPSLPTNGDKHMHIFDRTQPDKMFSLFNCTAYNSHVMNGDPITVSSNGSNGATTASTRVIVCTGQIGIWNVYGDGLIPYGRTTYPRFTTGATAPGTPGTTGNANYGIGTIRDWEISAGVIKHALRYVLGGTDVMASGTFALATAAGLGAGQCYGIPFGSGEGGPFCDYWGPPEDGRHVTVNVSTTTDTLTVNSTSGIQVGWNVTGPQFSRTVTSGLPKVSSIISSTTLRLSRAVTVPAGTKLFIISNQPWNTGQLPWYTGVIPYGVTIGIPYGTTPPALTGPGMMLWTCIMNYGMFQRDTAGQSTSGIILSGDGISDAPGAANATKFAQMTSDWRKIIPYLRIMANQAPSGTITGSGVPINGGGTYPVQIPPLV